MAITALPAPPQRGQSQAEFSSKADALLNALPNFVTEANALQTDVSSKQSIASSSASSAQSYAAQAQAAAGAGGGTIFPAVTSAQAGKMLALNQAGTAYDVIAPNYSPLVVNGDFSVWQAGTTFSNPGGPTAIYCADGWCFFRGGWITGITASQIAGGGIKIQRTAADTDTANLNLVQSFETIEVKKWQGRTITVQFKALKGANFSGANLTARVTYGTGTDSNPGAGFTSYTTAGQSNFTLTTTKTLYAFTLTVPANATQLAIEFFYTPSASAAGADDSFSIFDAHENEGSIPEQFPIIPYADNLTRCQRYYQTYSLWVGASTAKLSVIIKMRSAPTITGGGAGFNSTGTSAGALVCFQTTAALQTLNLNARL